MPSPRDTIQHHQLEPNNTWVLEDTAVQIRQILQVNDDPNPTDLPHLLQIQQETGMNMDGKPTHAETIEKKEQAALRMALDLSRQQQQQQEQQQQEADQQAVMEQRRAEAVFREAREREKERKRAYERERERIAKERAEMEQIGMEREMREIRMEAAARAGRETERGAMREAALRREREEKAAALRRAMMEEERERVRLRQERVLREQVERERELKMEAMGERVEKTRLEEAAVARAVEESIIAEAARRLLESEGKREGNRRVEAMAEKMRLGAEAKAQEERLRRRVEGRKALDWPGGGMKTGEVGGNRGMYGAGVPLLASRIGDVQACVGDAPDGARYPSTPGSYSTAYADGSNARISPPLEPTWYRYTQPLASSTSPSDRDFESRTQESRHWNRGLDLGRPDKLDVTGWRNTGKSTRHWRETTTERWERVIRREDEGHDAYRRQKEGCKPPRGFM